MRSLDAQDECTSLGRAGDFYKALENTKAPGCMGEQALKAPNHVVPAASSERRPSMLSKALVHILSRFISISAPD